jgi:ribonuclease PH
MPTRPDFREPTQLRPLACTLGEVAEASGSCTFSQGHTEATATVYGPSQPKYTRHEKHDAATLEVTFSVVGGATSSSTAPRERSAAKFLRQALGGAVVLTDHPRMLIAIKVCVVRDDGAMLAVALNAAALALVDAGVAMRYVPYGVAVISSSSSSSTGVVVLDPTAAEEAEKGDSPPAATYLFALNPSTIDRDDTCVLSSHATGPDVTTSQLAEALALAKQASKVVDTFARGVFKERNVN